MRVRVPEIDNPETFDGNHSLRVVSWLIPYPGTGWMGISEDTLEQLMNWTIQGHLAWVVFPVDNFGPDVF